MKQVAIVCLAMVEKMTSCERRGMEGKGSRPRSHRRTVCAFFSLSGSLCSLRGRLVEHVLLDHSRNHVWGKAVKMFSSLGDFKVCRRAALYLTGERRAIFSNPFS